MDCFVSVNGRLEDLRSLGRKCTGSGMINDDKFYHHRHQPHVN